MSEVMEKTGSSDRTTALTETDERRMTLYPPADVFEDADGIKILLDMPGVSKERLNLQADGNSLLVEGDVEIDMPDEMESYHADVRATRYRRSFSLSGAQLETDSVQATLKNGVLQVDIPKRAELRPRKIEVKAA